MGADEGHRDSSTPRSPTAHEATHAASAPPSAAQDTGPADALASALQADASAEADKAPPKALPKASPVPETPTASDKGRLTPAQRLAMGRDAANSSLSVDDAGPSSCYMLLWHLSDATEPDIVQHTRGTLPRPIMITCGPHRDLRIANSS